MFDHCLYFNTTALARLLEREWALAFKPFELTPPQAFMLRVVLDRPALLQSELADKLTIARATATRTLDGLEMLKLVERRSTARDGREYEIHPTAKAVTLKADINAASAEVTKRLKKSLGVARFEDAVGKVRAVRVLLSE